MQSLTCIVLDSLRIRCCSPTRNEGSLGSALALRFTSRSSVLLLWLMDDSVLHPNSRNFFMLSGTLVSILAQWRVWRVEKLG